MRDRYTVVLRPVGRWAVKESGDVQFQLRTRLIFTVLVRKVYLNFLRTCLSLPPTLGESYFPHIFYWMTTFVPGVTVLTTSRWTACIGRGWKIKTDKSQPSTPTYEFVLFDDMDHWKRRRGRGCEFSWGLRCLKFKYIERVSCISEELKGGKMNRRTSRLT